jgi:hypothetical protein
MSIVEKNGQFTFILHAVGTDLEPIISKEWYSTETEAKNAGHAALDFITDEVEKDVLNSLPMEN